MPNTISIASPASNSTVGTSFSANGLYTFAGSGSFVIECYLEFDDGVIEADSVDVNTTTETWSASFSSVPTGSGYTLRVKLRQGGTQLATDSKTGITVS